MLTRLFVYYKLCRIYKFELTYNSNEKIKIRCLKDGVIIEKNDILKNALVQIENGNIIHNGFHLLKKLNEEASKYVKNEFSTLANKIVYTHGEYNIRQDLNRMLYYLNNVLIPRTIDKLDKDLNKINNLAYQKNDASKFLAIDLKTLKTKLKYKLNKS